MTVSSILQGCKEKETIRTHKEVFIDGENYVRLNIQSFENSEAVVRNYNKIKYEIMGRLSGNGFSKTFEGVPVMDFELWRDKIVLVSLHGFMLYVPEMDTCEWIHNNENMFVRYPIVKIDTDNSKIYALCSFYPEMLKQWVAIDIERNVYSAFAIEDDSLEDFELVLIPGGAMAKMGENKILIHMACGGEFEFITEEQPL